MKPLDQHVMQPIKPGLLPGFSSSDRKENEDETEIAGKADECR